MKTGTIWAFDLGKGSIGEAVRLNNQFLHKASLLIPADFAETKTAAGRRLMARTREAHKARERWLDDVMRQAGIEPLPGRRLVKVDEKRNQIPQSEWKSKKGKWQPAPETEDQRRNRELLEREFAKPGDPTCYTSCLLRIKLLRGEKPEPWQIYKALHSAIQKRGYGKVPWAAREQKRTGKSDEEMDKELAKKDPAYKAAVEAWPKFKGEIKDDRFHFPCYYDAMKMGLWKPDVIQERIDCQAQSTRRVRFERDDVEKEIAALARQAAEQMPQIKAAFETIKAKGWTQWNEKTKRGKHFFVAAKDFGEFLVHGPAGEPPKDAKEDFGKYLDFRKDHDIHSGSVDDWMGATAQKIPRFDNRIINDCALLDGLQVCNVTVRYDAKSKRPFSDSILPSEVTFLMKLKNTLVEDGNGQRKLSADEIRKIFNLVKEEALAIPPDVKDWSKKFVERFALTEKAWGSKKGIKELGLRPLPGQAVIKSPKFEGRSRFSRPALKLIRALILEGQKPSEFHARLMARDKALLDELRMDVLDNEPTRQVNGAKKFIKQPRPWILVKHLKFLEDLIRTNNTWEAIYIPEQRLDVLEARHAVENGEVNKDAAIRELLGNINDPIVRHRLGIFANRLKQLQNGSKTNQAFGIPATVVIEFVRDNLPESFLSQIAQRDYGQWVRDNEKARKESREMVSQLGATGRDAILKFQLLKAQGFECIYFPNGSLDTKATRSKLADTECPYTNQQIGVTNIDDLVIDHIVPRQGGYNGPDSFLNKVVTTRHVNEQMKKCRTPFEWFHQDLPELWPAYVERVEKRITTLGKKKVQLLTRQDAPELAGRYTALAETAWVAKLAQKIVSLQFGWRNGIDYAEKAPVKRVVVISGGLTGRVRRKYRLNSILNPPPPGTTNLVEWESKAEKNRSDNRHHALDAMVISFLPHWLRDEKKENFFRFPDPIHKNAKAFFESEIADVVPEPIAFKKPALEEKIYGIRNEAGGKSKMVRRLEDVRELPYKMENMRKVYDISFKTVHKRIENIRDVTVREMFQNIFADKPNEQQWKAMCDGGFFIKRKDGTNGPQIKRLLLDRGSPDEYLPMSSDGKGYRRGEPHKGQIVFWDKDGNLSVKPVYAHGSVHNERAAIERLGRKSKFYGFFRSDCTVITEKELPLACYKLVVKNEAKQKRRVSSDKPLAPGKFILNTIITKSLDVEMSLPNGTKVATNLEHLVKVGFRRAI